MKGNMTEQSVPQIAANNVAVSYGQHRVLSDVEFAPPIGEFTVIIGPNGCGKSTLLKTLARMLNPHQGTVSLGGVDVRRIRGKTFACTVGLLAQSPASPGAISVADLVSRGRFPHQSLLRQWSTADAAAVMRAMDMTGTTDVSQRQLEELSGGQRQRAWIAMTLAQDTDILLLDEPTTFLDLSHQLEVLDLCAELHCEGRTIVAVLHDLHMAARYATHLVVMRSGQIVRQGNPSEVITPELLADVFALDARVIADPETGAPLVIPKGQVSRPNKKKEYSYA